MADVKRTKVFISYSHKDIKWLERLQVHLKPLEREGLIDRWDDTRIRAGERWRDEINRALDESAVAVFLVSADFLASDFAQDVELPTILRRAAEGGVQILPVIVGPCLFERSSIAAYQAVNPPEEPLSGLGETNQETALAETARAVLDMVPQLLAPVETVRAASETLFGGEEELQRGAAGILEGDWKASAGPADSIGGTLRTSPVGSRFGRLRALSRLRPATFAGQWSRVLANRYWVLTTAMVLILSPGMWLLWPTPPNSGHFECEASARLRGRPYVIDSIVMLARLEADAAGVPQTAYERIAYTIRLLKNASRTDLNLFQEQHQVSDRRIGTSDWAGSEREVPRSGEGVYSVILEGRAGEWRTLITGMDYHLSRDVLESERVRFDGKVTLKPGQDFWSYPNTEDVICDLTIMVDSSSLALRPSEPSLVRVPSSDPRSTSLAATRLPLRPTIAGPGGAVFGRWSNVLPGEEVGIVYEWGTAK